MIKLKQKDTKDQQGNAERVNIRYFLFGDAIMGGFENFNSNKSK